MSERIAQTQSTITAPGKSQATVPRRTVSIRDASPNAPRRTRVRFNVSIYDEPASWILEWRRRGIVSSARDVLLQSLQSLRKQILETDTASMQVDRFGSRKDEVQDDE
jgi:hypothetical protein